MPSRRPLAGPWRLVKVVVATQTGSGRVVRTRRFTEDGYIVADNLTPKKARIGPSPAPMIRRRSSG